MAALKAPAGGIVSHVNGQFYNGGEFTPDHGLYCGKGKNRVSVAAIETINVRLGGIKKITWNEQANAFQLSALTTFANGVSDWQVRHTAANIATLEKFV